MYEHEAIQVCLPARSDAGFPVSWYIEAHLSLEPMKEQPTGLQTYAPSTKQQKPISAAQTPVSGSSARHLSYLNTFLPFHSHQ